MIRRVYKGQMRNFSSDPITIQLVTAGITFLGISGIIWKTNRSLDKIFKDRDNTFKQCELEDKKAIKQENFWYKSNNISELNKTLRYLLYKEQNSTHYLEAKNKMSEPVNATVVCDNMAHIQSTLEEYDYNIQKLRELGKECGLEKDVDSYLLTESYKSKITRLFGDNCEYCEKLGEYNFNLKALEQLLEKISK